MDTQNLRQSSFSTNNTAYLNDTALHLRLNTNPLLEKVELFLRGRRIDSFRDSNKRTVDYKDVIVGEPLMNDKGVQHVLNSLNMLIGSHTVLGNLESSELDNFIFELDTGLSTAFVLNMGDWGLKAEHYDLILTNIILASIQFFSRTKEGFENNNLQTKVHSVESNTLQQRSGGLFKNG